MVRALFLTLHSKRFTLMSFTPVPKFSPLKNVGENFDYCKALHLVSKSKAVRLWLDFKTSAPQGCPSDDRRDGSRGGKSVGNVSKVESSRSTAVGLSASGSLLQGAVKTVISLNAAA